MVEARELMAQKQSEEDRKAVKVHMAVLREEAVLEEIRCRALEQNQDAQ